jgi:hypothetical protein
MEHSIRKCCEVGGAKGTGLASFVPASFLKRLFVQSEAESRNFGEVSRVLHLAVKTNVKSSDT